MPEREVAVCSADEGQQARNSCPELRIFFLLASHGVLLHTYTIGTVGSHIMGVHIRTICTVGSHTVQVKRKYRYMVTVLPMHYRYVPSTYPQFALQVYTAEVHTYKVPYRESSGEVYTLPQYRARGVR